MPSWNRDSLPQFRAVLKAFQPDIVHVQYPTQGYDNGAALALLMLMACALRKFAVVSTWHEYPPDEFTRAKVCQMTLALISRAIVVVRPDYPPRVRGLLAAALAGAPIRFVPNASVIPRVTLTEERARCLAPGSCAARIGNWSLFSDLFIRTKGSSRSSTSRILRDTTWC